MKLKNEAYDGLKFIALVILPAAGALYFALAGLWGFPAPEQVVGTITAFDTFLGVFLHASSNAYNASGDKYSGTVHISPQDENGLHEVKISDFPAEAKDLIGKQEVHLKVQNHS